MAHRHTEEFKREAVRIALTSGLSRKQLASDLGIGFSTLSKWAQSAKFGRVANYPKIQIENGTKSCGFT